MIENIMHFEYEYPALGRYLLEAGFGAMNANAAVGYHEWALTSIAVLIAMGDATDQMDMYLGAALKHGATEAEIQDMVNLASAFAGPPRAINAVRRSTDRLAAARGYELPKERIIRLADHDTFVRDTGGDGTPIILIHALSLDSRMWRDVFPRLAAEGRVVAYDLRGMGYARGAPSTRSIDHLAEDLRVLLDTLAIERADVYGISYGGAVAQSFAIAQPHRLRSCAFITTAPAAGTGEAMLAARGTRAEEGGMESVVAESLMRWFLPEAIARNSWGVRFARECVRRARIEEWAAAWKAMSKLDCLDRLGELQMPVLALAGAQDVSAPPLFLHAIANAVKFWEYRELNPGTHMMPMEQPDAFATELIAFRRRVGE
jgi:3-oxoadipate enol-lactonase